MTILFALFDSEKIAAFGRNCLTVVGAFIAGYIVGAIASWAADKWLFARRSPDAAKKAISVIVGFIIAAIVAFLVFGDGAGSGWLGGGDGSTGTGTNNPDNSQKKETDPPKPVDPIVQPKIEPQDGSSLKSEDPKVHVTFLGGDAVQGDRFYLLDSDPIPKTFPELKAFVQKKRTASMAPLTLVVLYPSDPRQRIDPNSINVAQVTSWAEAQGIGVYRPAKK